MWQKQKTFVRIVLKSDRNLQKKNVFTSTPWSASDLLATRALYNPVLIDWLKNLKCASKIREQFYSKICSSKIKILKYSSKGVAGWILGLRLSDGWETRDLFTLRAHIAQVNIYLRDMGTRHDEAGCRLLVFLRTNRQKQSTSICSDGYLQTAVNM